MKQISHASNKLDLLFGSLFFIRKHFSIIVGLGLVAAFGRVIQLGGFGEIPTWANIVLEIIVEVSRILLLLFVLGMANIRKGVDLIKRAFSKKSKLKTVRLAIQKLKVDWLGIALSFVGFLIIAGLLNFLINHLAYQTCLYLSLKREGILVDTSSEWTIILFFKNILVIPFTLVFESLLILWLGNKLSLTSLRTAH